MRLRSILANEAAGGYGKYLLNPVSVAIILGMILNSGKREHPCHVHGIDGRKADLRSLQSESRGSESLLVVLMSNFWNVTEQMLASLVLSNSKVDLVVWDDYSGDGSYERLVSCGIHVRRPSSPGQGITRIWNTIFSDFMHRNYETLILSNNDVLFPKEALESLIEAASACVVHPLFFPVASLGIVSARTFI